jgi:soluble lytic murein transglycosylase-like protein
MAALIPLAALLALAAGPDRATVPMDRWHPFIEEASTRFGVPSVWIERVLRAESAGTILDGAPIRSRVGAIGLMQLMPQTWIDMRAALHLGGNPDDPHDNILAGSFYLRQMYDRFGYPGLFAAYNAGPARYAAHLATGAPLAAETRSYLAEVTDSSDTASPVPGPFAIAPTAPAAAAGAPDRRPTLFIPLNDPSAERR